MRHYYLGKGIPYDRKKIVKLIREEGAEAKRQGRHRETNPYSDMDRYQWWVGYDEEELNYGMATGTSNDEIFS